MLCAHFLATVISWKINFSIICIQVCNNLMRHVIYAYYYQFLHFWRISWKNWLKIKQVFCGDFRCILANVTFKKEECILSAAFASASSYSRLILPPTGRVEKNSTASLLLFQFSHTTLACTQIGASAAAANFKNAFAPTSLLQVDSFSASVAKFISSRMANCILEPLTYHE